MTDKPTEAQITALKEAAEKYVAIQDEANSIQSRRGNCLEYWDAANKIEEYGDVFRKEAQPETILALIAEREALREDLRLAIMSDSEEVKVLSVMTSRYVEALTPSASTKAAYMGEFSMPFPEMDEDGKEHMRKINVPWTTIKEVMAAISARAQKALGE